MGDVARISSKIESINNPKKKKKYIAMNEANTTIDIQKVQYAYDKIIPFIANKLPTKKTRNKVKTLMESFLPEYNIKCDEENNPVEIIDFGHIAVRITTKPSPDTPINYIDIIF